MKLLVLNNIFLLSLLVLSACSNTTPQIGVLNSISDGLTMSTSLSTSTWQNVQISGQCTPMISKITITMDSVDQEALCTNNSFSLSLTKADLTGLTNGSTSNVYVKATNKMGITSTYTVVVKYLPSVNISQEILAGAAVHNEGGLKLKSRIRFQKQNTLASGSFKLKGWVR